ncbi:putative oxalocrotonate tautomerase [Roridomyces roridus]|uniref:Oxalocrotonate tautomerase n=1 Tax=Roridomyces roridus TaxID=1738132 RepID=A0AAD7F780_9AGAR|nr:putative oxalocrotonate tautomerase [Roridomyces roridus]
MPLHRFFIPKGLYTASDKAAIARAVTEVYKILPKFYVVVLFIELDADPENSNFFVGGEPNARFVRIAVEHYARNFGDDDQRKRMFMDRYEAALEPFTKGRGIDWEVQVSDADRVLWNENGVAPPVPGSEGEKIWKQENRAVSAEEMEALKAQGRL